MEKLPIIIFLFIAIVVLLIFTSGVLIGVFGFKAIIWILATIGIFALLKLLF